MRDAIAILAAALAVSLAGPARAEGYDELSAALARDLAAAVDGRLQAAVATRIEAAWRQLRDDTATRMDCAVTSPSRTVCSVRLRPQPVVAALAPPEP